MDPKSRTRSVLNQPSLTTPINTRQRLEKKQSRTCKRQTNPIRRARGSVCGHLQAGRPQPIPTQLSYLNQEVLLELHSVRCPELIQRRCMRRNPDDSKTSKQARHEPVGIHRCSRGSQTDTQEPWEERRFERERSFVTLSTCSIKVKRRGGNRQFTGYLSYTGKKGNTKRGDEVASLHL